MFSFISLLGSKIVTRPTREYSKPNTSHLAESKTSEVNAVDLLYVSINIAVNAKVPFQDKVKNWPPKLYLKNWLFLYSLTRPSTISIAVFRRTLCRYVIAQCRPQRKYENDGVRDGYTHINCQLNIDK